MAQAEILPTHTPALFERAVKRAAEWLAAGEVVALPTETVYGLAANALNPRAVQRIYEVKGRPAHNPIIVHVDGLDRARDCAGDWPAVAQQLARAFWPGPLTLVVPRASKIPDIVTAGGATVGLRWPSHPLMQAVIRACGFPLAAPSANLSSQLSPTNADHVRRQLGDRIRLIVDGGQAQVGIESTVVDVTTDPPEVLRPGMIHEPALVAVLGRLGAGTATEAAALRSPGLLLKHYAPQARLVILSWSNDQELHQALARARIAASRTHVIAHTRIPSGSGLAGVSVIPHDAEAYARALYAELHRCDSAGAAAIVIEAVPEGPGWHAIADRLNRAAAGSN
ncbi:MAG: L-threonylcarbamoyladenylate synthase [Verrucomicrobia bacterium]|jgi:L-threonylcarbamoyladenylate synthase|nr:L-threonylcarbamoyladenylate synthase [Verrucomicrobiota bacterium]